MLVRATAAGRPLVSHCPGNPGNLGGDRSFSPPSVAPAGEVE